jgi:hypothetical protein
VPVVRWCWRGRSRNNFKLQVKVDRPRQRDYARRDVEMFHCSRDSFFSSAIFLFPAFPPVADIWGRGRREPKYRG